MTTHLTQPATDAVADEHDAAHGECDYCGRDPILLAVNGRWCSLRCAHNDRSSETTWRRTVAA